MNEREEFLKYIQSVFAGMADRIQTMTESQVLHGLREVKTARQIYKDELVERFKSMTDAEGLDTPFRVKAVRRTYSQDADALNLIKKWRTDSAFHISVQKLRSRLSSTATGGSPPSLFDTLEDALNQRLETLRREGK